MKARVLVFPLLLLLLLALVACKGYTTDKASSSSKKGMGGFPSFLFSSEGLMGKDKLAKDLYNAIYALDVDKVRELLAAGADPNCCRGECGWIDSNPLDVIVGSYYDAYKKGKGMPDSVPDIDALDILRKAGADIKRRPYVWHRVYTWDNIIVDGIKKQRKQKSDLPEPGTLQEQIDAYVSDCDRVLEALIKAGADPDMKGHPYPYSEEAANYMMTDKDVQKYFEKGSRAINVAIEKGIVWESQVDLLLKYTKLDEESLRAAERSKDPKMIEKINKLWAKQTEGR
jgi:hypothetical protein